MATKMAIHITTIDMIMAILNHDIITNVIIGTSIHANTIMADTIITTISPEVITSASTDIIIGTIIITRNQDILMGAITTAIIIQIHLTVTCLTLHLISTQEIRILCYVTDKLLGETQRQNYHASPFYFVFRRIRPL